MQYIKDSTLRQKVRNALFNNMIYDMEEIKALIEGYAKRHPLAEKMGGEYIMQDDEAQEDALQLVCDIFDSVESEDKDGN